MKNQSLVWPAAVILALALALAGCAGTRQPPRSGFGDYLGGQHARNISDSERAAMLFSSALEQSPRNMAILQEAFSLALLEGEFDRALDMADRQQKVGQSNGLGAMLLSLNAFRRGRYEIALTQLEEAKGTGFDSLVAPVVRAWIRAAQGDAAAAVEALGPLGAVSVFDSFRRTHTAYIFDYLGRNEAAEAAFRNALAAPNQRSLQPVMAFGSFLERQGRLAEAGKLYRDYLDKLPATRQLQQAAERLDAGGPPERIFTDPQTAVSLALLVAAGELSRDNARTPAILYARLATFLAPGLDEAYILLGNLFLGLEQPRIALRALKKIPAASDFSEMARIREALAWDNLDETDRGLEVLQIYLRDNPDSLNARTALGDLMRGHEWYDRALGEYELAVAGLTEPGPGDWFLFFARAICYERLDRWSDAEADFKKALELRPDEPQVLNYLGYSWIDRGLNIEPAKIMIQKAVEQRPNDGYIVDSLGWVQYLLGEYADAVQNLERAVLLQPEDPTINDHLGDAYWMAGRELEARFQWKHALALKPEDEQIPKIQDKIAFGLALGDTASQ